MRIFCTAVFVYLNVQIESKKTNFYNSIITSVPFSQDDYYISY